MAKTRKTERAVEIHEFYVVRSTSGSLPVMCVDCSSGDAIMLAPEQAAVVAHVPVRMIYWWAESGLIHHKESRDGSLTVCVKSLTLAGDLEMRKGELK